MKINCDSMSAIYLVKNQINHARTKHIDVRFYFIWINYVWLDPVGHEYVGNHNGQPIGVDMVLWCVRLRFEKSSPRWRIVGRG